MSIIPCAQMSRVKVIEGGVLAGQFVRCQIYVKNTGIWGYPQGMIKMKIVILSS